MDEFETLIPDARAFLGELSRNNRKDWWQENKATYDAKLKAPSLALLERLAPELSTLTELPVTTKLFRAHRDVRFSKDKTPYNTHLHMVWIAQTGGRQDVAFFFGVGVDYVTVGGGIIGFDKPVLEDWRLFADQDYKRMNSIIEPLTARGFNLRAPELKRVPPAYDKDHPAGDLLRMKGCIMTKDIGPSTTPAQDIIGGFKALAPLNAMLTQIAAA